MHVHFGKVLPEPSSVRKFGKPGECLQSCRRSYLLRDSVNERELLVDNQYIMSPKDLKTIDFLDRMIGAGVRVFKIEGRARSPEYVHTVVSCYAEAVQAIIDGSFPAGIDDWNRRLSEVFNRGFWDGWYLGQPLGEWTDSYGSKATKSKVYLGVCRNYYGKLGVGEFMMETGSLVAGDELLVIGPTSGVLRMVAGEIRVNSIPAAMAAKGDVLSLPLPAKVRPSDKLFKLIVSKARDAEK